MVLGSGGGRTCKQSAEQNIRSFVALEHILIHHFLPACLLNLSLEEADEI
jgi:hypothetical protein